MFAFGFFCASHSFAADPITVKAISVEDWARENSNFKDYVSVIEDNNIAICGGPNLLCNIEQNQCVRCHIRVFKYHLHGVLFGANSKVGDHWFHYCLPKDKDPSKFADENDDKNSDYRVDYECEKALGRANFDSKEGTLPETVTARRVASWTGLAVTAAAGVGAVFVAGEEIGTLIKALTVTASDALKETQGVCAEGSDGKTYCLEGLGDDVTVTYGDEKKATTKCEILPVKLYNLRKCFFCPLIAVIYNASGVMPNIAFSKLASAFATLIVLGLAIWIAFQTLTHVSSLTKQDAPKFLGNLIKQSYKFLIAFLLLQNSSQIFNLAVTPLLDAGIAFGGQFLTHYQASESAQQQIEEETGKRVDMITPEASKYYTKSTYQKLDLYVGDIQREISFMQAVGTSLICTGNRGMFHTTDVTKFSDGFKMFIQGLVIAAFAFLLSIAFAFYMIDAVVQLGIVGALMPFLIASWPFKVTAQYAGTGFKMLLNSVFVFVFIGLVVSVDLNLIGAAMTSTGNQKQVEERLRCQDEVYRKQNEKSCQKAMDEAAFGGLSAVAEAINAQDENRLIEITDISGMGFLILLFCCIFGFKFMGQVSNLAGQFSSGGIKPIAPSIATMGGSAALSGAKKLTKPVREAVGRKAEDLGMGLLSAAAHPVRTAKSTKAWVKSKFSRGKAGSSGGDSSGGDSGGDTEEKKKSASSGTTENSSKKKTPVVGQKDEKTKKTESTKSGSGPTVGQKPAAGGSGEATSQGGESSGTPQNGGSGADAPEASAPATGNETAQPVQNGTPATASQKQRKYSRRKNKEGQRRTRQRRNYGRRHK